MNMRSGNTLAGRAWTDAGGRRQAAMAWGWKLCRICMRLSPLLLMLLLWFMIAWLVSWLRGVAFPTPADTAVRLLNMLDGSRFLEYSIYRHTCVSLARWALSFFIAAVAGLAVGIAAGWWRAFEQVLMPAIQVLQLVPGLAWIPVAILIFGIGESATLFMISVTAFAPIAISVAGGVKRVDELYVRAARMMGLSRRMLFFNILVPGALPHIINGLRIGLGNGWRVLVAAEMIVGSGTGLGYAIIQSRWTLDFAGAFVCLGIICVVGLAIEQLVFAPLERRTVELWGLSRHP